MPRRRTLASSKVGAGRRFNPHVVDTAELAVRLARLDLVIRRHLGRPDVSRVSPGYGAAVVLLGVMPIIRYLVWQSSGTSIKGVLFDFRLNGIKGM